MNPLQQTFAKGFALLAILVAVLIAPCQASYHDDIVHKHLVRVLPTDTIFVDRNTVVYFSITDKEFEALSDPDLSEVMSDFEEEINATSVPKGVRQVYTASRFFRIKCSGAILDRTKLSDNLVGEVAIDSACRIKIIPH